MKANKARGLAAAIVCLAIASTLGAQDWMESDRPVSRSSLKLVPVYDAPAWILDTVMEGAAYSWRITFPEGKEYDAMAAAVLDDGKVVALIGAFGRPVTASKSTAAAIESAAAAARSKKAAPDAQPFLEGSPPVLGSSYYFPGWTALDFGYASASFPKLASELRQPIASSPAELPLPSPALLEIAGQAEVAVFLKLKGKAQADVLLVATTVESIEDERAMFSKEKYRRLDFAQKELILLSECMEGDAEYRIVALKTFPGRAISDADWEIFKDDPDLPAVKHKFLTQFLNTSFGAREYNDETDDIMTLGFEGPEFFETLYGVNRLPFIAAYYAYTSRYDCPIFVSEIQENHPDYDPELLSSISEGESLELAKAASSSNGSGMAFLASALGKTGFAPSLLDADGEALLDDPIMTTEIEAFTKTLVTLSDLRPGDIAFRYGTTGDAEDPLRVGVIVSVPSSGRPKPGEAPEAYLKRVKVAVGAEGGKAESLPLFAEGAKPSFASGKTFQLRRVLKRK